jgi:cation diffusion facilitator CzcD-associated flavoprotein CzcO
MSSRNLKICIVGAGMSGLLMGIRLKKAGIEDFQIYEKKSSLGGTWRENTYPGLACDVPSHFYSYSFELNPEWTHRFSPQAEILAYFQRVAEKYEILPHIKFDHEVTSARYEGGKWFIETSAGEKSEADVLIAASGPLHHKHYPAIEGLESFEGAMFHSAAWDYDVKLEGRRIGVIGTGSTGVQMMAPLSEVASHVSMFQRTAEWIMPMADKEYTPRLRRWLRRFPIFAWLIRMYYKRMYESFSVALVEDGSQRRMMNDRCRAHLASVEDPELRRKLTPDYQPMCKRLVLSVDFYPTLQKEHVELVTDPIDHIEARGVVTEDGRLHELDILVLATGFDAQTWGIDHVVGEEGLSLEQAWAKGTRPYRSVTIPGFPNFFMLVGPFSPLGNVSIIDVSEHQVEYILKCIRPLREGKATAIVPKAEAAQAFHKLLLEATQNTVWVTGCNSWYLDEEGVPIAWPWSAKHFHKALRRPIFDDYELRVA